MIGLWYRLKLENLASMKTREEVNRKIRALEDELDNIRRGTGTHGNKTPSREETYNRFHQNLASNPQWQSAWGDFESIIDQSLAQDRLDFEKAEREMKKDEQAEQGTADENAHSNVEPNDALLLHHRPQLDHLVNDDHEKRSAIS